MIIPLDNPANPINWIDKSIDLGIALMAVALGFAATLAGVYFGQALANGANRKAEARAQQARARELQEDKLARLSKLRRLVSVSLEAAIHALWKTQAELEFANKAPGVRITQGVMHDVALMFELYEDDEGRLREIWIAGLWIETLNSRIATIARFELRYIEEATVLRLWEVEHDGQVALALKEAAALEKVIRSAIDYLDKDKLKTIEPDREKLFAAVKERVTLEMRKG